MELIVMALILAGALFGQYFLYARLGQKNLTYTLTIGKNGNSGGELIEVLEGEEIEITEQLDNAKRLPLPWVRTEISCSSRLLFFGSESKKADSDSGLVSGIFTLKAFQKCRRTWRVRCSRRGLYGIEDVSVTVSDLLGLVRSSVVVKPAQKIRVLPLPSEQEITELSREVFIGDIAVRRLILPDPFAISGAREYTGREPMNRIHWSQTARTGSLMVYNNEFTTEHKILIAVNIQRSFHGMNTKIAPKTADRLVKAAAYFLDFCLKTDTECALTVNSLKEITPVWGGGYAHVISLMRELAELEEDCGRHIDDFLQSAARGKFTDLIFITSFLDDSCAELLQGLEQNGINTATVRIY